MVYKARKQSSKYHIKLDLARKRRDLLKKANELLVIENESFVFADINSNVCVVKTELVFTTLNLNTLDSLCNFLWSSY